MSEPFGGQDIAEVSVEWVGGDSAVLIQRSDCMGDLQWAQAVSADEARGLCWAIANLYEQEINPQGTAVKLAEGGQRNATPGAIDYDRVRREVPECAALSDVQIDWCYHTLCNVGVPMKDFITANQAIADMHELAADADDTALTPRGREVLAAIDACRAAEPEPDPWSNPERVVDSCSVRYMANGVAHRTDGPAYEKSSGYRAWYQHGKRHRVDGPAVELPNGRRFWYLHGVHYETEDEWRAALPEPARQWSEPVEGMNCARLMQVSSLLAEHLDRYDAATGRVDLTGLQVVSE